jgi:hypothetical protein
MIDKGSSRTPEEAVDDLLRAELAHGDIVLGTVGPILGHLLANHDHSLFSDEVVARIRGMAGHVARQLAEADLGGPQIAGHDAALAQLTEGFSARLFGSTAFLGHCHALSLEWQLSHRLEDRSGIDPVLSPLLQALIASDATDTGSAAMAALAAQARFMQQQRRMELPLAELPADLFHQVLTAWREHAAESGVETGSEIDDRLRQVYDEGASRRGLLSRLAGGMGSGIRASLSIAHAGTALFLTSLAAASRQDRDLVAVATNESQRARLALTLRAAGLSPREVEEQFLYLHPDVSLPVGFDGLRIDLAAELLTDSPRRMVG